MTPQPAQMRVAITTPTTWPRVRRGAERFCNELAAYLVQRGHHVTIVSAKPGSATSVFQRGYTTRLYRRRWHPALAKAGLHEFHVFSATAAFDLLTHPYDVVLSSTFMDALAATIARRFTGTACIFWVNGLPPRIPYVRSLTLRGAVFRRAIRRADEVVALSSFMQRELDRRFGRAGIRIPVPVDTERFQLSRTRDHDRPVILCAAALDDVRKGGRLLMRAFDALKMRVPRATLRVSSTVSEATKSTLLGCVSPRWRPDVQFLGAGRLTDLPAQFGSAAISVLSSRWEPFGMVVLESLATGTPVVATREGAIPELIANDTVGRLFDPGSEVTVEPTNVDGLAAAMAEGLELSRQPDTADRCRARAEEFSWRVVGPRFENMLAGLAGRRESGAGIPQSV